MISLVTLKNVGQMKWSLKSNLEIVESTVLKAVFHNDNTYYKPVINKSSTSLGVYMFSQ